MTRGGRTARLPGQGGDGRRRPAIATGQSTTREEHPMSWKKPRIVEVSVAMEINCYACAEV